MAAPVARPPSDGERHHLPTRRARGDLRDGSTPSPLRNVGNAIHFYAHPCNYHFYAHAPHAAPEADELGRPDTFVPWYFRVNLGETLWLSFVPSIGLQRLGCDPKSNRIVDVLSQSRERAANHSLALPAHGAVLARGVPAEGCHE